MTYNIFDPFLPVPYKGEPGYKVLQDSFKWRSVESERERERRVKVSLSCKRAGTRRFRTKCQFSRLHTAEKFNGCWTGDPATTDGCTNKLRRHPGTAQTLLLLYLETLSYRLRNFRRQKGLYTTCLLVRIEP